MSVARIEVHKTEKEQYAMEPKKFLMWIFLVTIAMLFGGLTSAMIVRRADGNWTSYQVPAMFTFTTIVIVLSSFTMQWAYISAKKNDLKSNRIALWLTITLGVLFGIGQYAGYKALLKAGIYVVGNPSGSFFYVVSGVHLLHVIGGILFVLATLISSYRYKVHSKNMLRINLCTTYWHFIGALWVYLFMILNVLR